MLLVLTKITQTHILFNFVFLILVLVEHVMMDKG